MPRLLKTSNETPGQERLIEQNEATLTLAITCHEACLVIIENTPETVHCPPGTLHKNTADTAGMSLSSTENKVLCLAAEAEFHP